MYYLKITHIEERGWMWEWRTHTDKLIKRSSKASPSILEMYREAVVWASTNGPEGLCHHVIQFKGA